MDAQRILETCSPTDVATVAAAQAKIKSAREVYSWMTPARSA